MKEGSNIQGKVENLIDSLHEVDLTSDKATEGIYYALSSILSMNIIMSRSPLPGRTIAAMTAKHMHTKTLPKYRYRLRNVYVQKIKEIEKRIEDINNEIDDDNRGDKEAEIAALEDVRDKLRHDLNRVTLVK